MTSQPNEKSDALDPHQLRASSIPPTARKLSYTASGIAGPIAPEEPFDFQDDSLEVSSIIIRSFSPTIAVYSSYDTEDLVRRKGVYGGLCGLLKPFGEKLPGNVVVRHSRGASRSFPDFGVKFVPFPFAQDAMFASNIASSLPGTRVRSGSNEAPSREQRSKASEAAIEQALRYHLQARSLPLAVNGDRETPHSGHGDESSLTFLYYLRKILSDAHVLPHEMFTSPVACVIAVSSQNPAPIDTLRDLYNETRQEHKLTHPWVGDEFLRYYVLVHDDDHDEIADSMNLFNLMKRHFGLHCHLLRIRSEECDPSGGESVLLPLCEWLSAEDDLYAIRQKEQNAGIEMAQQYVFDTDAAVIRTFIRELVTQSIIPFMEGRIATWNDQVISQRRGMSGRFLSLSKKWTGFGTNRSRSAGSPSAANSSKTVDQSQDGLSRPDTLEATMHRLADYAFMLRDWGLASSTYDLLRTDMGDDKAWSFYAVVNEMAAFSLLRARTEAGSAPRFDMVDQLLDTASYTYLTRCSNPQCAARCILLATELQRASGDTGPDEAARWAGRLFELNVLDPLAQNVLAARTALSYALKTVYRGTVWGSGHRRRAYWEFLTAKCWTSLEYTLPAKLHLERSIRLYRLKTDSVAPFPFPSMQLAWASILEESRSRNMTTELRDNLLLDEHAVQEETENLSETKLINKARLASAEPPEADSDSFRGLDDPLSAADDGFVGTR